MGFADSIRKSTAKVKQQVNTAVNKEAIKLFKLVVAFSPAKPGAKYAKGEFINNWMVQANGISFATRSARSHDGMASLTDISTVLSMKTFVGKDGKVTLTNNTSYGYKVEYAGWVKTGKYAPVAKAFVARKAAP